MIASSKPTVCVAFTVDRGSVAEDTKRFLWAFSVSATHSKLDICHEENELLART